MNPFHEETTIDYVVPTKSKQAEIKVYNQNGILLKSIRIANMGKGELRIQAGELPAGTYSYSLVVDGQIIDTKQMILTRF